MLLLAIYFACGIALAWFEVFGFVGGLFLLTFIIGACAVKRSLAIVVLPVIFIPLGTLCYQIEVRSISDNRIRRIYDERKIESREPVAIEGVMVGFPDPAYDGSFLRVRVDRLRYGSDDISASGDVRLFLAESETGTQEERLDLRHGSRIRIACRLEREGRFLNPGVASAIETLDRQGIDATGVVKSPLLVEHVRDESVFLPLMWAYRSRLYLIERFRTIFSAETSGVMIASLLGDDNFLDRHTADAFRDGGTFHVLVISGLHITFIGGLAIWLTSFLTKRVVIRSILACSFLWAYTFAVGAEIPVVRASLMFSFLLLGRVLYRNGSLLNALGTCTLLILAWRPSDLFSPSFQLTFISVAAIVGCSFPLIEKLRAIGEWYPTADTPLSPNVSQPLRRFCEFLYWNEDTWRIENRRQIWSANLYKSPYLGWMKAPNLRSVLAYIFEGLLVSLVVQIWMLPLLVLYFHRLSPPGLFLNLWVGIFLAMESFAAIGAAIASAFSEWLAAPIIALTELFNAAMLSLPVLLSSVRIAGFRIPIYADDFRIVYYIYCASLVISSTFLFHWKPFALSPPKPRHRRLAIVGLTITALIGCIIIFHPFSSPAADGLLRIEFLDVGQGDSALVTFPDGQTMLIDGGGKPSYRNDDFEPDTLRIGERVVSEFLWEKGYSRIDHVVVTHADADHIQGLTDVARNFDIGKIYVGTVPQKNPDFEELLALAQRGSVPVEFLKRGDSLDIGGVALQVLNPRGEDALSRASANNASIVIHMKFGVRSLLLTGDIERATEDELVNTSGVGLDADVVKVPHHGSKTSSTDAFVGKVEPNLAVISVGRRSRFGHPHEEVVRRWIDAGCQVLTTGERGTITVETDGNTISVRTFLP
jgi:competence protein ComEC